MVPVPWLDGDLTAWWQEVDDWVQAAVRQRFGVAAAAVVRTEARVRPWGVTAPVLAPGVSLYFKATDPARRMEVELTHVLATQWPSLAPSPHACDHAQGWMLTTYHGEPIATALPPAEQVSAVCSLLADVATMQMATSHLVDQWLEGGVPDRRVEHLAAAFENVLPRCGLTARRHRACVARLEQLRRCCTELGLAPQSAALEHADIHGRNVLTGHGRAQLIDWGDCCITHPFTAPFVPIRFVAAALPAADRAAAALRMRNAYLEPWGGATDQNLETFAMAQWVAPLVRVLGLASEDVGTAEINELVRDWLLVPLTESVA